MTITAVGYQPFSQESVGGNSIPGTVFYLSSTTSPLDLTGTWSGTVTATTSSGFLGPTAITYVLKQVGSTVTGTVAGAGSPLHPIVSATLAGSTLSITSFPLPSISDDCHLYSSTFTYTVSGTTMTLTSASGTDCKGNGTGGHSSLDPIIGVLNGTLNKS